MLIMQTTPEEALQFLKLNSQLIIIPLIFNIILFFLNLFHKNLLLSNSCKTLCCISIGISLVTCFLTFPKTDLYRSYADISTYFKKNKELDIESENFYAKLNDNHSKEQLHFIVIGESSNREHWSLYGYNKETTPLMEYISKSEKNFAFSNNVWAADKYTEYALQFALTEKNQYVPRNNCISLVDVFNKAGFFTVWISNQNYYDSQNSSYNIIASRCKKTLFLEKILLKNDERPFDEIILTELKKLTLKRDSNYVIFIHLIGSHFPYEIRYPNSMKKWDKTVSDLYDNTIRYTDFILSKLFNTAKAWGADSFIYFSDHGEKPGVKRNQIDIDMFKIPFLVYFKSPTDVQYRLLENTKNNTPFSNDCLYDTLIGCYGISTNRYIKENDLSSISYIKRAIRLNSSQYTLDDNGNMVQFK